MSQSKNQQSLVFPTGKSGTLSNTRGPSKLREDHPRPMPPSDDSTGSQVMTLDEVRDGYILWMLNRCGGNRVATARLLGIGRTTLYRYLKKADCEKRDNDWPQ